MLTPGTIFVTGIVAALLVGTKRLRTLGEDLGAALKGFRKGLQCDSDTSTPTDKAPPAE